jgi:hypothetical protein
MDLKKELEKLIAEVRRSASAAAACEVPGAMATALLLTGQLRERLPSDTWYRDRDFVFGGRLVLWWDAKNCRWLVNRWRLPALYAAIYGEEP